MLVDTCLHETFYLDGGMFKGPFSLQWVGCTKIEGFPGRYYDRIDTFIVTRSDTLIHPLTLDTTIVSVSDTTIETVRVKAPDTLKVRDTCSCIAEFSVPLGCFDSLQVQLPVDTTLVYCDSACGMYLPRFVDSLWVKINDAEKQTLQSWQQQMYGVFCDTSREGQGGTITGVKDSYGNWVFDLKERRPGWPRKTPVGYLPTSSDTCQIRYSLLSMFYPVGHTANHDSTWVDSVFTVVDCSLYVNGPYRHKLIIDTVCVNIPTTVLTYRDVPVWVPAGRDTTIYVDTCLFECPKFYVTCEVGYFDTSYIVTDHWDVRAVFVTDTQKIYNCKEVVSGIPVYLSGGLPNYTQYQFTDSALAWSKRALHGCDSTAGKEPVLFRRYIDPGTGYQWVNVSQPRRFCGFTLAKWDTYRLVSTTYQDEEWCWLPTATIDSIVTTNCQWTCSPVIDYIIPDHWGNCARKDTTIIYYCPDPYTGVPQPYFHTYKVEDKDADTARIYHKYLSHYDSTLISSDTTLSIKWVYYPTPQYIVSYEDTCVCEDVIHVTNGDVPLCEFWIENPCDPLNPIYKTYKPNGQPVINVCVPPIEITINGWKRSRFDNVVFDSTLDQRIWLIVQRYDSAMLYVDSLVTELLNCCTWPDSLQILRTQVDSLRAELAACCASRPDFGTLTLGGDGTAVLDASDSCIIIASYADNSGTAGDDPVTVYHDGSQWKFIGAADRVINYVIKCP